MTAKCHLVIPDLFLPQEAAGKACAGISVPMLEKLLVRAQPESLRIGTLEEWLCRAFGAENLAIAPVTLLADGMQPGDGYWLRADPVHIQMQRDRMILQADVPLDGDEAAQLCASLNAHFAPEGLHFFAPHPQRWYLRPDAAPDIMTYPPAQAAGRNLRPFMPQGKDALRWHRIFNEIQMLFFEHPVNQAREARNELTINSIWVWGGGRAAGKLAQPFAGVHGDSALTASFAQAAGIPCTMLADDAPLRITGDGDTLVVWEGLRRSLQRGDVHAWRNSLQRLEKNCAAPLWRALCDKRISRLTLDAVSANKTDRFVLTRAALWRWWRLPKPLTRYALV